jgi:putative acetyltransferase
MDLEFRRDHLTGEQTRALEIDKLRSPDIMFWSVYAREELVGCGALKRLDARRGELKSMRVADSYLGRGVGRAILEHLVAEARTMGMQTLWLETGSESAGFTRWFMTRAI